MHAKLIVSLVCLAGLCQTDPSAAQIPQPHQQMSGPVVQNVDSPAEEAAVSGAERATASTAIHPVRSSLLDGLRIGVEIGMATATAVGLAYAGVHAADALCQEHGRFLGCLGTIVFGGVLGAELGIITGVYVAGTVFHRHGTLWGTCIGALLGTGVSLGLSYAASFARVPALMMLPLPLALVGAILGYELTASEDDAPTEESVAFAVLPSSGGAVAGMSGQF